MIVDANKYAADRIIPDNHRRRYKDAESVGKRYTTYPKLKRRVLLLEVSKYLSKKFHYAVNVTNNTRRGKSYSDWRRSKMSCKWMLLSLLTWLLVAIFFFFVHLYSPGVVIMIQTFPLICADTNLPQFVIDISRIMFINGLNHDSTLLSLQAILFWILSIVIPVLFALDEIYSIEPRNSKSFGFCRICHRPIHKIPKIEEKELVIGGVRISVNKYPLCCKCYEEYKKWSKIIDGGV